MTFVFDEFELDPARRELRADGNPRQLQPQVFDLLLYLVENRERVVPKRELLDTLWPETIVTESSIQRAVSLARSALGERGPELIQTFPRQGYRFVGKVRTGRQSSSGFTLQPRYAQSGDVHIAYATLGSGDADIVVVNGWSVKSPHFRCGPRAKDSVRKPKGPSQASSVPWAQRRHSCRIQTPPTSSRTKPPRTPPTSRAVSAAPPTPGTAATRSE